MAFWRVQMLVAQELRVLATLVEDWTLVPSTYFRKFTKLVVSLQLQGVRHSLLALLLHPHPLCLCVPCRSQHVSFGFFSESKLECFWAFLVVVSKFTFIVQWSCLPEHSWMPTIIQFPIFSQDISHVVLLWRTLGLREARNLSTSGALRGLKQIGMIQNL